MGGNRQRTRWLANAEADHGRAGASAESKAARARRRSCDREGSHARGPRRARWDPAGRRRCSGGWRGTRCQTELAESEAVSGDRTRPPQAKAFRPDATTRGSGRSCDLQSRGRRVAPCPPPPSSLDLDTFCARYLAAWNDHDAGAMGDLVTEDIVWEDPALPGPGARRRRGPGLHARQLGRLPRPALRRDRPPAPHRGGRSGRVALADARHDERAARPAGVRADRAARWRSRASTCGRCATGASRATAPSTTSTTWRASSAIAPPPGSRAERAMVAAAAPAGADAQRDADDRARLRRRRRRRERRRLHGGAAVRAARRARRARRAPPGRRRLQDRLHALHPAQRDADDREAGARGADRGARRGAQLDRPVDALRRLDPPSRRRAVRLQRHAPRCSTRCCAA